MKLMTPRFGRFRRVLKFLPPNCGSVADIGADHGLLSHALMNYADKVYAIELSEVAAHNGVLSRFGESDSKIEVMLGFGIQPLLDRFT